jgi:hypothetical protein
MLIVPTECPASDSMRREFGRIDRFARLKLYHYQELRHGKDHRKMGRFAPMKSRGDPSGIRTRFQLCIMLRDFTATLRDGAY